MLQHAAEMVHAASSLYRHSKSSQIENFLVYLVPGKNLPSATTTLQPPPSNVEKPQKLIPSYKTFYLGSVNEGASTCSGNGSRRQLALQTSKKFTT